LIKPGAGVGNIVDSSIRNLTKNDVIVLNGGSNDVNKVNKNVVLHGYTVHQTMLKPFITN